MSVTKMWSLKNAVAILLLLSVLFSSSSANAKWGLYKAWRSHPNPVYRGNCPQHDALWQQPYPSLPMTHPFVETIGATCASVCEVSRGSCAYGDSGAFKILLEDGNLQTLLTQIANPAQLLLFATCVQIHIAWYQKVQSNLLITKLRSLWEKLCCKGLFIKENADCKSPSSKFFPLRKSIRAVPTVLA